MKKSFLILIALGLLVSLILAACGDNTATSNVQPAVTSAATTASTIIPAAPTTAMAGMTTTPPAGATTAAGSMPGMGQGSMIPSASDPMTESLQRLTGQEFETKFMQEMIVHHQSAIDMAKLVPANTKRSELLKLSQDIITAQTKEISDMTSWLSSWLNAKPLTDSMSVPGMMEMMGSMDKLKAARDTQFDEMFLQMMITHHQQAVNMANLLPTRTQRPELLKLGQDIIKAQTAEIEQMKGWQKEWKLKV